MANVKNPLSRHILSSSLRLSPYIYSSSLDELRLRKRGSAMVSDNKGQTGGQVYQLRLAVEDPMDGSGAGDAPDGWYEPDLLTLDGDWPESDHTVAPVVDATGRQTNESRIISHLETVFSSLRRNA